MAGELIEEFGERVESITLMRGASGEFEVSVDGELVFSKKAEHRQANPGEIVEKIGHMLTSPAAHEA